MECSTDVQPPAYLQRNDTYDLSSVADPDYKASIKPFNSLQEEAWPRMEELGLDESQMKAFKLALTKELAIIQGPPGTGKKLKNLCQKHDFNSGFFIFICVTKSIRNCKVKFFPIKNLFSLFFLAVRKNLRWPKDRSGTLDQPGTLGRTWQSADAGCVLHQPCPGSVP